MKRHFPHNTLLDTNVEGLAIIRRSERFESRWYKCPAGVWTIGYGTTENLLPGINRQTLLGPITKADAERLLRRAHPNLRAGCQASGRRCAHEQSVLSAGLLHLQRRSAALRRVDAAAQAQPRGL